MVNLFLCILFINFLKKIYILFSFYLLLLLLYEMKLTLTFCNILIATFFIINLKLNFNTI